MDAGIDQGAVVVLAVDLDQERADLPQQRHRDRLVVDEGAAPPVAALDPAQDQFALAGDAAFAEQRPYRVAGGEVEDRRHVTLLGTLADQRAVAAPAKRQRQGVEQDRLAGAGFAGEHRHALREID